jgi:peptidoglycan-associated lipoprotein
VRFDFDRSDIREGDAQTLRRNADVLKKFDFLKITIEGHCDERGTVEYNLALGERRAKAAYDYLLSLGVAADRMKTVSYGKEVPLCQEHNEDCWARNRRAKFAVTGKTSGR